MTDTGTTNTVNMNTKIQEILGIKDVIKDLNKQVADLKKQQQAAEIEMMELLDEQGVTGTRTKMFTVTITEAPQPTVTDWDELYKFISKNEAFGLLQRRVSSTAYREYVNAEEVVPGVETYNKRAISMRKI